MEIGIVGLPNVGKSTLFNALTGLSVPAEKFPFTTIEPNYGIVPLPDKRLETLGEIFHPEKLTPTTVKFVDIAGLVKGSSKGLGLGNKFLSYIREVDAIVQVVRLFKDDKVPDAGNVSNPAEEIEIIDTELVLADLEQTIRAKEMTQHKAKSGDIESQKKLSVIEEIYSILNENKPLRNVNITEFSSPIAVDGKSLLSTCFSLLTTKPVLYVLNINEKTPKEVITSTENFIQHNKFSESIRLNVQLEYELMQFDLIERRNFVQELGFESAVGQLIEKSYRMLNLVTFYTVVGREVRAWSIPHGTDVKKASGKIHSDMERGFIRAEVYSFDDLVKYHSEDELHKKGLIRTEGKDYVVCNGDILRIKFSS